MCGRAHGWRPAADLGAVHAPATTVVAGVVKATAAGHRGVVAIVIRMPNYVLREQTCRPRSNRPRRATLVC